jgi:hypothetical protein
VRGLRDPDTLSSDALFSSSDEEQVSVKARSKVTPADASRKGQDEFAEEKDWLQKGGAGSDEDSGEGSFGDSGDEDDNDEQGEPPRSHARPFFLTPSH